MSFPPTIPGTRVQSGISSHFGLKAAPKPYGSPELGVRNLTCIGGFMGAHPKKDEGCILGGLIDAVVL